MATAEDNQIEFHNRSSETCGLKQQIYDRKPVSQTEGLLSCITEMVGSSIFGARAIPD